MTIDYRRIGFGAAIAVVLLFALVRISGIGIADLGNIVPGYVVLGLGFSLLTLTCRAANYRLLAHQQNPAPFNTWLKLAAKHQFLFSVVPSGLGDAGFPVLAKQHVALSLQDGVRVILLARARDALILLALAAIGASVQRHLPISFLLAGVAFVLFAFLAEPLISLAFRILRPISGKFSHMLAAGFPDPGWKTRVVRTVSTLASWLSAACAIAAAFASAGATLHPGDVLILMAGLNVVGLLAISIGGLGIAEAGSAGILALLGYPLEQATQMSLLARPVLLISVLGACIVLGLSVRVWTSLVARSKTRQG